MKIAYITMTILILSNNILSQKENPCADESDDAKTNADCCIKKNAPKWCPDISVDLIKKNLSKMKNSSKARSFSKQKFSEAKSVNDDDGSRVSLKGGALKSPSFLPGKMSSSRHFGNFWWPYFCDWNVMCCSYCYLFHIDFMGYDYMGYLDCIWSECTFFPGFPHPY